MGNLQIKFSSVAQPTTADIIVESALSVIAKHSASFCAYQYCVSATSFIPEINLMYYTEAIVLSIILIITVSYFIEYILVCLLVLCFYLNIS